MTNANNTNWLDPENTKILGHRILIRIEKVQEKTKSGIILPGSAVDESKYNSCLAQVVKLGDGCYKDKMFYGVEPWCAEGDWIIFPRNAGAGTRLTHNGEDYLLIEDTTPLIALKNKPEGISRG